MDDNKGILTPIYYTHNNVVFPSGGDKAVTGIVAKLLCNHKKTNV